MTLESTQAPLLGEPSKICYACGQEKSKLQFHKNKRMADGRLNLCKSCHYAQNQARRLADPDSRKIENARRRERAGNMTWQEYMEKRKKNAKGRKAISCEYAQRRRLKTDTVRMSDFDSFAVDEAYKLRDLRKKATGVDWHVDHIVPLNHRQACGLHNAYNIQVVPAQWNLSKKHVNMDKYFGA